MGDYQHVVPVNDLIKHNTDFKDEFDNCPCNPEIKRLLVIHNSLDGREYYEQ